MIPDVFTVLVPSDVEKSTLSISRSTVECSIMTRTVMFLISICSLAKAASTAFAIIVFSLEVSPAGPCDNGVVSDVVSDGDWEEVSSSSRLTSAIRLFARSSVLCASEKDDFCRSWLCKVDGDESRATVISKPSPSMLTPPVMLSSSLMFFTFPLLRCIPGILKASVSISTSVNVT